jgi:hypothetical protein
MKTFISTLTRNTTRNPRAFFEAFTDRVVHWQGRIIAGMRGLCFGALTPVRVHSEKRR